MVDMAYGAVNAKIPAIEFPAMHALLVAKGFTATWCSIFEGSMISVTYYVRINLETLEVIPA